VLPAKYPSQGKPNIPVAVYTVAEVAALLGVGLATAYRMARNKHFPVIRLGWKIVIPKKAFHRWLNECGKE